MQAAVRVWARTGDQSAIDDYERAAARLPGHQRQVRELAEGDPDLNALLDEEEAAARTWATDYAEERLAQPGGPGTFQRGIVRARHGDVRDLPRRPRRGDRCSRRPCAGRSRCREASPPGHGPRRRRGRPRRCGGDRPSPPEAAVRAVRAAAGPRAGRAADGRDQTARRSGRGRAGAAGRCGRSPRALNDLADAQGAGAAPWRAGSRTSCAALDSAKDDFVSNVSHELRTPLTTISGLPRAGGRGVRGPAASRATTEDARARQPAQRRHGSELLIDDLLALSQAEARRDRARRRSDRRGDGRRRGDRRPDLGRGAGGTSSVEVDRHRTSRWSWFCGDRADAATGHFLNVVAERGEVQPRRAAPSR